MLDPPGGLGLAMIREIASLTIFMMFSADILPRLKFVGFLLERVLISFNRPHDWYSIVL